MAKVVIVGGGWAGCGAAVAAAKTGAEVVLLERTDMLLGTGLAGGYFRNNGRYTAAEEIIAMGASEMIDCMDQTATNGLHGCVEMPHHKHGSVYNVFEIEPTVRRTVEKLGVDIRFEHRFVDVNMEGNNIKSVKCANGEVIEGDAFVDCTGTTGSQNICNKYGSNCCCCVLRCPTFGSRRSVAEKAGVRERSVKRKDGSEKRGAYSGACEIPKETVSPELRRQLEEKGSLVIPLPEELIDRKKLEAKACQQYADHDFADNLVFLDNGYFKLVAPYFALKKLRKVAGFENAKFEDPYSGGRGNSIRYTSIADRENTLQAKGVENLFCAGEKAGTFVGHTEAACLGTFAANNAARRALGMNLVELPEETVLGGIIAISNRVMAEEGEDLNERFTFSGGMIFEWMKEQNLYTTDKQAVRDRIEKLGLSGFFANKLC